MRRGLALAAALVLVASASVAWRGADDASARLSRSLAKMDALAGVRLTMDATVAATGPAAPGGALETRVHIDGVQRPPDRLRLAVDSADRHLDVVVIGQRTWVDEGTGSHQSVRLALGPLRDATAALGVARGPGAPRFAGLGVLDGTLTYRLRIDLSAGDLAARTLDQDVSADARGSIELELGLFDDLVRSQVVEITESGSDLGTGLAAVRTRYRVDYREHGRPVDIREPE